jgi:uncharacterized hydrophobic protein (TIGR00271 family)
MIEREEEFLGELRVGRRITSIPRTAAMGLILTPGLILLLSVRSAALLGVGATAATVLMLVVLLMTLLNVFELLGGSSERGGTSSLVHESLGGFGGFLSGWMLLAGSLALAAIFSRVIGEELLVLFPSLPLSSSLLGFCVVILLILVQVFRFLSGRGWTLSVVVISFLLILVIFASELPELNTRFFQEGPSMTSGGLMRAAAWLMMIFICIEAVMTSRRLIRESSRRLPPALLWVLLGSALLLILGQLVVSGLRSSSLGGEPMSLLENLGTASVFRSWIIIGAVILFFLIAANICLMVAARQLYALSQRGAVPEIFRAVRAPFRLPPVLFGSLAILSVPLIFFGTTMEIMDLAAAVLLVPILLLNLAAIRSRQIEPDRRRTLITPFFPLVPGIALALSGVMLILVPWRGLLWGGLWFLLGLVYYQVYGRDHLVEAQEGVLVFGPSPERAKEEGIYRILVPVTAGVERQLVLELATTFAGQLGGELIALQVSVIPDPLALEQGRRLAQERNTLFQWSTRYAARSGVPIYPITRLARSVQEGILATAVEEQCDLIVLSWAIGDISQSWRLGRVLDPVIRQAPCDVAVLAFHPEIYRAAEEERESSVDDRVKGGHRALPINRILVTTAGGPHAPLASRLALLLAREYEATTSGLYVAGPGTSDEELELGRARIEQTLTAMRQQVEDLPWADVYGLPGDALPFESQVVRAESVLEGIIQAGGESDLVLMGASEESMIDQVLFGTLVEDVARSCSTPVLMVKRYRGLPRIWFQRLWDAIVGALPSLSVEDRLEVYKQVRRSSRPDVDFFIMIGLSAIIAGYGLLQDSSAVIIGGMLVAPLFSPILAISMSIVMGDIRLLRLAIEAALKGIVLAVGVAIFITAISPLRSVGAEITARIAPNLFDLAVALASGAAGAYAISRKDVAAALPGVAIAAALVPPLCVVGIGIAAADMQIAGGGGFLFITNLVAIVLAGSVTLLLLGFRPAEPGERAVRLRRGLVVSLILLVVIAVPLAVVFVQSVEESGLRFKINEVLLQRIDADPQLDLLDFDFEKIDGEVDIQVRIYAQETPTSSQVDAWRNQLSQTLGAPVQLNIMSIGISKFESSQPE